MQIQYFLATGLSPVIITSCTMPREGRKLKKVTRDWYKSPVALNGYADNPLGSASIILYENKKIEMFHNGLFMVWYQAGSWGEKQDTINFSFMNSHGLETDRRIAMLNKEQHSMYLYGTDTLRMQFWYPVKK